MMLAQRGVEEVDPFIIMEILNSDEEAKVYASELNIDSLKELFSVSDVIARHSSEEYQILVGNVLDCAFRRETCACLEDCLKKCRDLDLPDFHKEIYDEIDNITSKYTYSNSVPLYSDVVSGIWEHVKARQRGETNAIGFPFTELNKYVVLEPGECVCFTGGPKAGKSAMLLTITVDMLKKNKSILYVDSEISTELFTIRLLSHLTGIKFGVIRSGKFSAEDEVRIQDAISWIKTRKFVHVYMPVLQADSLYLITKKAKHLIDIDCVVVDYLKADSTKDQAFEVYANLGNVSDVLKNKIAGEMGIAALTAAQSTSTGRIADSSRIARSMSTVISIIDKDIAEAEEDGTGATKKIRVLYNRNGAQMTEDEWIDMVFDGSTCKYMQAAKQHEREDPF